MELLLELALTISLPFLFTFFLVKLTTMHPISVDSDEEFNVTKSVKFNRYQLIPNQAEVIELNESQSESKSLLRLSNVKENNGKKFEDVAVVEEEMAAKSGEDQIENMTCRLLEELIKNEGERKGCTEIEIESAEEEEEDEGEAVEGDFEGESGNMNDWVEIDFVEMPK